MSEINVFKSPIMDCGKQVGSMMIIRGVFSSEVDSKNVKNYFQEMEFKIIDNEIRNRPKVVFRSDDPKYPMTIVIEGINDLPFRAYPLVN